MLVQSDGNTLKIDSIELEHKQATVYNMTVDEFHTYFVSDLDIWVHNTKGCNWSGGTGNPVRDNMKTRVPNESVTPPAKRGNAPIGKDGKPIEIHHEGQDSNGPFHEMTQTAHRGGENYKSNHPNYNQPSQIDRNEFNKQKRDYWEGEWDSGRWDNE